MTDHEDITRMKSNLRLKGRATRRAMTPELRQAAAEAVAQVVLGLPELRDAHAVGAYGAMPEEVDADPLIQELWSRGVRVALPRVVDKLHISWHWYECGYSLCRGAFGLREPCEDAPVASVEEIDAFVVPGVAFDRDCRRLGMGGGYYDRLIASLPASVPVIGLAYEEQVVESVPCSDHDQSVHIVCTPSSVYRRE
ncbi:MAG: 5-formyltetrahydrofolate cyclo-ligase [Coriobacteriales bacterium]|nr:5-formyltetrahydrofolate cyclo-ligase [Actinomycetes bacterium]